MRRLCLLFALLGLMSVIVVGASGTAEARAARRRTSAKTVPAPSAASVLRPAAGKRRGPKRTRGAARATLPTSPDVIPRRLLIVGFDGRGAQAARSAAAAALRDVASVAVVPLGPSDAMRFGTAYGAEKTVGLAQRLNLTALLFGKITQAQRAVHLDLLLANGEDGRVVGEIGFDVRSLGALRTKMRAQLWSKLEPLIDQAASPGRAGAPESPLAGAAPESPTQEAPAVDAAEVADAKLPPRVPGREARPGAEAHAAGEQAEGAAPAGAESAARPEAGAETEDEPETPPSGETSTTTRRPHRPAAAERSASVAPGHRGPDIAGGLAAVGTPVAPPVETTEACPTAEVSPAAGVMARRFNYRDEQRGALRGYYLYRAAVGRVDGNLFPFAGPRCHGAAMLGLHAAYEQMAPLNSQLADRELGTQGSGYEVDLALRLTHGRLTVQPAVGFFGRRYHVDGAVVPAADYRAAGGTLDVGWRGRWISLLAGAGAWRVLHVGDLASADWFPQQTANAFSAHVQLGVAANGWIDIVAGATAEYETFSFTVDQNAPNPNGVAAGAYDVYLQATLAARLRLGAAPARRAPPRPPQPDDD